jgi:hypothetical protein
VAEGNEGWVAAGAGGGKVAVKSAADWTAAVGSVETCAGTTCGEQAAIHKTSSRLIRVKRRIRFFLIFILKEIYRGHYIIFMAPKKAP